MQVYTKEVSVLAASIMCVSCRGSNQFAVSNSHVVKLVGSCDGCPWLDTIYRWTITRQDGVTLPVNLVTTTTGADSRNLVVRSSVIEPGFAYRFFDCCCLHQGLNAFIFIERQHACACSARHCYVNSVRPSVCLSVSHTLVLYRNERTYIVILFPTLVGK